MRRQAIKEEAAQLMREYGEDAYDRAREAMREARRRKHIQLERYFAKVAVKIAELEGRQVGEDTATRYTTHV
jgi:hypothetical protein